jgi:hypothetical protein
MKGYEKKFLERLIKMYGDKYASMFYEQEVGTKVTEEMLEEARVEEDELGMDLNMF